jgi:hypothetical protein
MGAGALAEESVGVFVGFTTATFNGGSPGGRVARHAACDAEFTGSHFCHFAEFALAGSAARPTASGAWIDPSTLSNTGSVTNAMSVQAGRLSGTSDCSNWTSSAVGSSGGYYVDSNGNPAEYGCSNTRQLACCSTPSRVGFAGFTSATTTGNAGGHAGMNGMCQAQFPSSHLCHTAEYMRANSGVPVPASGAWLDPSAMVDYRGSAYTNAGLPTAGRYYLNSNSCYAWTSSTLGNKGEYMPTNGGSIFNGDCSAARVVACCF